jgi:hypothetical protein
LLKPCTSIAVPVGEREEEKKRREGEKGLKI